MSGGPSAIDGGRLLAQGVRIVAGLIGAFLVAGLFLVYGLFRALDPAQDPVGLGATAGFALVSASVIGGLALAPALAGVLVTELFRLTGLVTHLAIGGAIGGALWLAGSGFGDMATEVMATGETVGSTGAGGGLVPGTTVALAAGFLAGFAYWLLAGRQAGCWRRARPATEAPPRG